MNLEEELQNGGALPAYWYNSQEILEKEYERIFHRTWQYIGRTESLARVGDFITGFAGRIPILVTRNKTGLAAFINVCRHRRHEVLSGEGRAQAMTCPYHGWTYDLNGKLVGAPRCGTEATFKKEDISLTPVKVEAWGPFVFVNPDLEAASLRPQLGDLDETISRSGLNISKLVFKGRTDWAGTSNWKVMLENYLECYHCPIQHPKFSKIINVNPGSYSLRTGGLVYSQTAPLREKNHSEDLPYNPEGEVKEAQYHFIWPNLTLNINPGPANLSIDLWLPDGVGNACGISDIFFGVDVSDESIAQISAFNDEVSAEDERLTNSVQRSIQSGLPLPGRLLPQSEQLIARFQKQIYSSLSNR